MPLSEKTGLGPGSEWGRSDQDGVSAAPVALPLTSVC